RSGTTFEGDVEFAFRHTLTREVAYATLPKDRRARLHARFARWIEEWGGGCDKHAPLLAYHYAEAARPEYAQLAWGDDDEEVRRLRDAAVRWLTRAATLAIGRFELDDAVELL